VRTEGRDTLSDTHSGSEKEDVIVVGEESLFSGLVDLVDTESDRGEVFVYFCLWGGGFTKYCECHLYSSLSIMNIKYYA
jgi:hypothetical protein